MLLSVLFAVAPALSESKSSQEGLDATENSRLSKFNSRDFIIDLGKNRSIREIGNGGTQASLNVKSMPALKGHNIAMNLIRLDACGINLPHTHPRATEALYGVKASNVTVGYIPENFGKIIINHLSTGQATFFPQGYIHFQFNNNCKPAVLLASFNHDDPGTLTINANFWQLPQELLEASIGLNTHQVETLKGHVTLGVFPQAVASCRKRCGLEKKAVTLDTKNGKVEKLSEPPNPVVAAKKKGEKGEERKEGGDAKIKFENHIKEMKKKLQEMKKKSKSGKKEEKKFDDDYLEFEGEKEEVDNDQEYYEEDDEEA